MKNVKYRKADSTDYDFVYTTLKENMQSYFKRHTKEGWSQDKFSRGFTPERITIIEDTEGVPIAFYDCELLLYIHNIQIARAYQGKGYFRDILSRIERKARQKGASKLVGKVFTENSRTLRLSKSIGFEIKHSIPEESSVWLEKTLKP